MNRYIIVTGGHEWRISGTSPFAAVKEAFKATPPVDPGILVSVTALDGPKRGVTFYIDTIKALKEAGHRVETRRP